MIQQTYASLLDSLRPLNLLNECSPHPESLPDELELQSIWFNGQFGRDFQTTCGKTVLIDQFGFWNRSTGPDFLHASVTINGKSQSGSLEIDTRSSDWESHGHDTNPAFNRTILHVVFETSSLNHFTRTEDHTEVPKVVIPTTVIQKTLQAPLHASASYHIGRCFTPLSDTPISRVIELLEQAARHRCQQKARRLHAIRDSHGSDQALWSAVAETLGYRPNKLPMNLISQRLPIAEIVKLHHEPDKLTAILFGTAGFLHPDIHQKAPLESQQWLENLWDTWWQERTTYELDPSLSIKWTLHGNRPINHPQRRLSTLAAIAQHWRKFRSLTDQPIALTEWLTSLEDTFWSHHYTLTSKHSEKRLALIGKDRIHDLIINHLLPMQITERNDHLWQTYQSFPAPAVNEKVKRAHFRLFGDRPEAKQFLKKSWHHQALLQIYSDFCLADTSDCAQCPFPEQLSQF